MPKHTSTAPRPQLIPAVAYTRRSTDRQEESIAEQIKAIEQYADDYGYTIIRWYTDDAISGDDTEKRLGFLQMLADAQDMRDFEAIVCWDLKRFGRFDALEGGYYIHPLRKAGIYLVLVNGGVIDWNESSGRIIQTVHQEGANKDLCDHSANVTRGQLASMQKGSWVGSAPYAYRIEGERKNKRLVLGEAGKVRIVQRIFREFVEERRSMRNIAERLQADGIMSPGGRGKVWRWDAVRVILENPAYCGDYAAGRQSYGKYHRITDGRVEKFTGTHRTENPESKWIVHKDHHESIIDRETFEKARAIFAEGKPGRAKFKPGKNPYALAGLLRCGRCGCPMWGMPGKNKRKYYECGHRQYTKASGKADCEGTTVREDVMLDEIASYLENWLAFDDESREGTLDMEAIHRNLKPDDLPEAFERVKKLVMPPSVPKQDRKRLEKSADQLRADLTKARSNLVLLDADNIPAAQDRIRELAAELAEVEEELKNSRPLAEKDINAVVLEVLRNLYSLASYCRSLSQPVEKGKRRLAADADVAPAAPALRRFLNSASHIVVHTTKTGTGKAGRHTLLRGEIVFKPVGVLAGNLNPRLLGPKPSALPN